MEAIWKQTEKLQNICALILRNRKIPNFKQLNE